MICDRCGRELRKEILLTEQPIEASAMLRTIQLRDQMFADLKAIDAVPSWLVKEHCGPEHLWKMAMERLSSGGTNEA